MKNYTLLYVLLMGFSSAMAQSKYAIQRYNTTDTIVSKEAEETNETKAKNANIDKRFAVGLKGGAQLTWIKNDELFWNASDVLLINYNDNLSMGWGWHLGTYINGTIKSWEKEGDAYWWFPMAKKELYAQFDINYSQSSTTYTQAKAASNVVDVEYNISQISLPIAFGGRTRIKRKFTLSVSVGYMPVFLLKDNTVIKPCGANVYLDTDFSNTIAKKLSSGWGSWKPVRNMLFGRIGFAQGKTFTYEAELQWGPNAQNKTYYQGKYLSEVSEFALYFTVNANIFRF